MGHSADRRLRVRAGAEYRIRSGNAEIPRDCAVRGISAFEQVPNIASDPGTQKFLGLRNPALLERVMSWQPDVVHINGWAWLSHLQLLHALRRRGVPTLFFGDS